jgi:hypothetical protein
MDIGKFADIFAKLAAEDDPPPGYAKISEPDPAVYQIAQQLLTRYWANSIGTLIPFTLNNIRYVGRLTMHGDRKAIEVFVKEMSSSEEEEALSEFNQLLPQLYWT